MKLDPIQIRVLGSLIEKEITTPENYPLSVNALINACNQRSSRDPVLTLSEDEVRQALHSLEEANLVVPVHDSRVTKYEHRIRTVLNLRRDETAVLCLLMLRGPQTAGELRSRADRLYNFEEISAVVSTLERLGSRSESSEGTERPDASGPLVTMLARQPGARESRYIHLLGSNIIAPVATELSRQAGFHISEDSNLREMLIGLQEELTTLRSSFEALERRVADLESVQRRDALSSNEPIR